MKTIIGLRTFYMMADGVPAVKHFHNEDLAVYHVSYFHIFYFKNCCPICRLLVVINIDYSLFSILHALYFSWLNCSSSWILLNGRIDEFLFISFERSADTNFGIDHQYDDVLHTTEPNNITCKGKT